MIEFLISRKRNFNNGRQANPYVSRDHDKAKNADNLKYYHKAESLLGNLYVIYSLSDRLNRLLQESLSKKSS